MQAQKVMQNRRELSLPGGRGALHIFWVRGLAIGKGVDFHYFDIRNGIYFHDFGQRNVMFSKL